MDRPLYEGRQQRDHPTYRSRSHDSRQQHSYRQDHSSSRPLETHHPHHPFYRHYLHTDPLRLNIDIRYLNMVVREAATTVAMFHSHSTILERMDATFLREQVSYLERVIKKMKDAIIRNSGKFLMPPPVTPLYQQRGHPSETYRNSHDSWQQHSYRQGHSSSRPLEMHHTDPLRLDIDIRNLNPVVRETAKTVAMYYSHPTLIDKMDKTFLRQQVYYLETVIKKMKHAIIRGSEKFVTPPPMTEGRSTMRRNAALKRKAVAAPEKFPVFEFKKPKEKEEGELDEDEPDSNVISPSAIITPSAIKRMKIEVEKKIEARRAPPLMRLPLSPVREEEEEEESKARRRRDSEEEKRNTKIREPEDSEARKLREAEDSKAKRSRDSDEEKQNRKLREAEDSKAKRRRDSEEEKRNTKIREAEDKADKDKKREEVLGKALTNALIDMDYLDIILKEEDLIPEIGPSMPIVFF